MKPKSSQPDKGPSQRQLRVGEEIRHVLADLFLRTEFHDKVLAREHITVSEVRMSPDLKHAVVFATVLGQKDITPLLPALKRVAPFLRAQIGPRMGLRVTPEADNSSRTKRWSRPPRSTSCCTRRKSPAT